MKCDELKLLLPNLSAESVDHVHSKRFCEYDRFFGVTRVEGLYEPLESAATRVLDLLEDELSAPAVSLSSADTESLIAGLSQVLDICNDAK